MDLGRSLRFLAAAAFGVACVAGAAAAQAQDVSIQINGQTVGINPPPILRAGRVFVPLRGVFEQLGAEVVYSNGEINATGNGSDISLHIGSTQASINGQSQTLDVAPFIIGASTYVPLRFVSQALGAGVAWDEADHVVQISMSGVQPQGEQQPPPDYDQGAPSYADASDWVDEAPPPIPAYEPPPAPDPNYVWMPGYWAWSPYGYYWVPGTWVPAPQPGLLWTPGYWGYQDGYYGWHNGYWAPTVGFYGGVYYGGGYYGNGFVGGRWSGNTYRYNTAVVRVASTIVNVYVDKTVIVNAPPTRWSFSGGPGGMRSTLTAAEIAAGRSHHVGLTAVQQQHIAVASQDRHLLATANHGKPPVVTATQPFTPTRRPTGFTPVTTQDKNTAQKLIVHPSFAHPAPPAAGAPVRTAPPKTPATTRPALHRETARPAAVRTAPPVTRTVSPVTRTVSPVTRTEPPVTRTEPPVVHTVPPVIHTRVPLVRTPPPAVRTPPPVVRTPAPVVHTPPPVIRTAPPAREEPVPQARTEPPAPVRTAPPVTRPPVTRTPPPRPRPTPKPSEAPQ